MERHAACNQHVGGFTMSEAIADRRRQDNNDRRSGQDRRVEEASFGLGPELTAEEIAFAEALNACEACGIIHIGRPCKHESAQPCGCDAGANWICEAHRASQKNSFGTLGGCETHNVQDCARCAREAAIKQGIDPTQLYDIEVSKVIHSN